MILAPNVGSSRQENSKGLQERESEGIMTYREIIQMLPDAPTRCAPQSAEFWEQFRCEMRAESGLVKYDHARKALAEATRIDEVKSIRDKAVAMQTYARLAKDGKLIADATQIKMRAERRLGEIMAGQRAAGQLAKNKPGPGRGKKGQKAGSSKDPAFTLAERGVDKHLADRARKAAAMPKEKFEEKVERAANRAVALVEGAPVTTIRGTEGTGEFERYTPPEYIEAARKVLGEIDLDPASCEFAQKWIHAKLFFTVEDNGLSQEWCGRIFLNPPYHRTLLPAFIDKLVAEIDAGHLTAAILLTNNSTDVGWFLTAASKCASVCFTHRRIRFTQPDGTEVLPTQGQAFFYYGPNAKRFEEVFCRIGVCFPAPSRQFVASEE